jgi:hypothetical protein
MKRIGVLSMWECKYPKDSAGRTPIDALLGWVGVALTGSDMASNVLFGSLQRICRSNSA